MMNPDFESTDLLIATVGALSKLSTTGENVFYFIEVCTLEKINYLNFIL